MLLVTVSGRSLTPPVLADSQHIVSLYVDGDKRIVTTDADNVGEVLHRATISLGAGDVVEPGLATKLPDGFYNINIYRSRPVVIVDGNQTYKIRTAHQSPRQIAADAGLTLYPEDTVVLGVVTDFVDAGSLGTNMTITRATPLTVRVDGKVRAIRTQAKTVRQMLTQQGIAVGASDTVTPAVTSGVVPGMKVTIVRVAEAVTTVKQTLARPTQTVLDGTLAKGTSELQQAGTDGSQTVTYRIHYRDGVETARETLKVADKVDPTPRIIRQGTKVFFAGSIEYWRPYVTDAAVAYGVNPDLMLGIMKCESTGNANASNGSHFGLYQYSMSTWLGTGGSKDNIYDGRKQIERTAWKIANYGLSPWLASKTCWSKYQ